MKEIHMEKIEHKTDEFFRGIENRSEELFSSLEQKGDQIFEKFDRKMTRALNTFWIVLGTTIVFVMAFMIDTSVAVSNKANAADVPTNEAVLDAFKLDYMRSKDTFILRDSIMAKFYEDRYVWQLGTILNEKK